LLSYDQCAAAIVVPARARARGSPSSSIGNGRTEA